MRFSAQNIQVFVRCRPLNSQEKAGRWVVRAYRHKFLFLAHKKNATYSLILSFPPMVVWCDWYLDPRWWWKCPGRRSCWWRATLSTPSPRPTSLTGTCTVPSYLPTFSTNVAPSCGASSYKIILIVVSLNTGFYYFYRVMTRVTGITLEAEWQGCGSGPFSAGSGSSKPEFWKPDPDYFFHIKRISSDIWMMIIFIWQNGKIRLKMCKSSNFKIFFPCLYNFTLPKYR